MYLADDMHARDALGRYCPSPAFLALTDDERRERKAEHRRQAAARYAARHPEQVAARDKAWREKNKIYRAAKTREHQQRNRVIIDSFKDRPCAVCDKRFPPAAMDLHHRDPSTKGANVSRSAVGSCWGEARLRAELDKCDVLCAICHRLHHYGGSG